MNKKLSKLFLVAILALASLLTILPQQANAQNFRQIDDPAPRKVVLVNQFNRRSNVVLQAALRASGTVTNARMLFLLSGLLGVPVTVLESDFAAFNLTIENFVLAQIIARSVGVPMQDVVGQLQLGLSFGQIAVIFNVPQRPFFLRLGAFNEALLLEIGISQGIVVADPAEVQAKLAIALGALNERFIMSEHVLGNRVVTDLVLRRLAIDTGNDLNFLIDLRGQLGSIELSEFVMFVLADNILSSAVRVGLEFNGNVLVTRGGIFGRFDDSEIPVSLLLGRVLIFTRQINNDTNGAM